MGKCKITYTKGAAFDLDENISLNTGAQRTRAAVGSGCQADFLLIPGGYDTDPSVTFDRYCGDDLYVGIGNEQPDLPKIGAVTCKREKCL